MYTLPTIQKEVQNSSLFTSASWPEAMVSWGRGLHFSLSGIFVCLFRLAGKRCSSCRYHMLFTASDREVCFWKDWTKPARFQVCCWYWCYPLWVWSGVATLLKTLLQLQFKDASVIGKSLQAYVHMAYAGDGEHLLKGKHSRNDGMNSVSLLQHTKVNFQDE